MRATLLVAVLAIAAPARPQREANPDEAKLALAEQILGEWVVVHYQHGGMGDGERDGTVLKITRNNIHIRETNGHTEEIDYRLRPARMPAAIDLGGADNNNAPVPAIVMVDGNQLLLCYPFGGGAESDRPGGFASPTGSNLALLLLRRRQQ